MSTTSKSSRPPRSRSLFFSYDNSPTANVANVNALQKYFRSRGYHIYEHNGSDFDSKYLDVDHETDENLCNSTAIIICISREYHRNRNCKLLAHHARKKVSREKKKSFEMLFVMMQGDYTTMSQPHKIDGWLRHLLRDCLWYQGWSQTQLMGAAEAIIGVIVLLTREVDIEANDPAMVEWKEAINSFGSPNPQKISKKWIVKSPSRCSSPSRSSSPKSQDRNRFSFSEVALEESA